MMQDFFSSSSPLRLSFLFIFLSSGILWLGLTGCSPESQLGEKAARERLRKNIIEVHERGDSQGLLDLYFLEGVEARDLRLLRLAIENEIYLKIRRARFVPLTPADGIDYEYQGTRYGPTLRPEMKLEVEYDAEDRLTVSYLIGFHQGDYRLITARPLGDATPDPGASD